MRTETPPVIRLEDYRPTDYLIDTVDLDIRLHPKLRASCRAFRSAPAKAHPAHPPLVLDGDGLVLKSFSLDSTLLPETAYEATPDRLTLHAPPAGPFDVEIVTEVNPSANSALMGLYLSSGIYTTQCEAEGFRRITYFYDRPDSLSVYTTRIEADQREAPILLSNGNPVEASAIEGTGRHYAIWHDPFPKPSYLFAVVGGALASIHDTFTTRSGKIVKLGIYCEHGKEERCRYALDALKRSMRWDEERFGLEYDLDVFNIVAVSHFNMGAMENKGLNIFNDKYVLVDPETGTDQDYAHVESVIAHEYFHNWTGNRITCRNWFQLCLKEGLTVFRDQEFTADVARAPLTHIRVAGLRQPRSPKSRPIALRSAASTARSTIFTRRRSTEGRQVCRIAADAASRRFSRRQDLFRRHDGDARRSRIPPASPTRRGQPRTVPLWYIRRAHRRHLFAPRDRKAAAAEVKQDLRRRGRT